MNIPNTLTLMRILLIPVFVAAFYAPGRWASATAAAIFGLAAITDLLDGYLARRLGQTSALGAFLDPVADKLMVAVALILLVQQDPEPWIAISSAIIVGREIAVSALREWMALLGERQRVAVAFVGKVKTTAQMLAILFMVYREPAGGFPAYTVGSVLLYGSAALTLWSMFVYLRAAWPLLELGHAAQHGADPAPTTERPAP
jgi:CDP-diacylglycerol--glycerol-3-phosphate 3-phosphatidyltransferase/cardiolipin synthase